MLPANRSTVKHVYVAVKFWWDGYDPTRAFDLFVAPNVKLEARSIDPTLRHWQASSASVEEVRDYMLDRGLSILNTQRVSQRRNQNRWEGLYIVAIGTEVQQ